MSTRRRTTQPAQEDQARLAAIVDAAVDAILTIDERGTIDSVNPATERLFGYRAVEILGRNIKLLMPQPYRREHDGYLRRYLRTGQAKIIGIGREVVGLRKDGSLFPLYLAVSEVRLGKRRMFTGIIHDLSGRRQLERQILQASTDEQRRIGQELHDGLCQDLVSVSLGTELLARKLEVQGMIDAAAAVRKLGDSVQLATDHARRLAHGLNPVDVDAGGLSVALEQLAARVTDSAAIACEFRGDGQFRASSGEVATHLYRIAQEAVGNAIKHGKATRINLSLSRTRDGLTLRIEDNGKGFTPTPHSSPHTVLIGSAAPPAAADSPHLPVRKGIGLQTMNYRAKIIGGTFEIRPGKRGAGTVVTCSVRDQGPGAAGDVIGAVAAAGEEAAEAPAPRARGAREVRRQG